MMKIIQESFETRTGQSFEYDDEIEINSIGSTANVVLIDYLKWMIYVANAGDTRCIMGYGGKF